MLTAGLATIGVARAWAAAPAPVVAMGLWCAQGP